jgi:pimeloyl-ACP methyl ester carboxylesterase
VNGGDPRPRWFDQAVAMSPETGRVDVGGAAINFLRWGDPRQPGLLFIHGGAAHAHWWGHVAPTFLPRYSAVAIDLSGHGDSAHRDEYSLDGWCDEVVAVIDAAEFQQPPVLVGHSMGGFVTAATAARYPDRIAGAVIIDSPIKVMDPEVEAARAGTQFTNPKIYDDPEVAIAKFRVVPEQDVVLPYIAEHIARHSLRRVPEGWTWKFDRRVFVPRRRQAAEFLAQIRCRVAVLRAEHGLVTQDIGDYMYDRLGRVAPVIELPTAGHHPMLDVPLILITAIRSLIADWEHSIPHSRPA